MTHAPHYDPSNIFARILRGDVPCQKIHETPHAFAFFDAFPKASTHALVIPKGAYVDMPHFLQYASSDEILDFWTCVHQTVQVLQLHEGGFRLINNCGTHGGQEVPHMHIHLLGGESIGPMVCRHT